MSTPSPIRDSGDFLSPQRPATRLWLAVCLAICLPTLGGAQLFTRGNQLLTSPVPSETMGTGLASGDFNGDGIADLAAGAPNTTLPNIDSAGEVHVWYGSANGLGGEVRFHQGLNGLPGVAESDDRFGTALTSGDFDGDGFDDLAVGVAGEDVLVASVTATDAGVVEVIYGSSAGLVTAGAEIWSQESSGITGVAEDGDYFGYELAAGDFDGDGFSDLAISAVNEDIGALSSAGGVWILFGTASGLTGTGSASFDEAAAGGTVTESNEFGWALATGDFDGDARSDLAIGVPNETVAGHPYAGAVWVLSGAPGGIALPGLFLRQGRVLASGTIAGAPEDDDRFGSSLAAGDFDRVNSQSQRYQDLAIGVPGEDGDQGAVEVLEGGVNGLTAAGNFLFREGDLPGQGAPHAFGIALAAGALHSSVRADLVVGAPLDKVGATGFAAGHVFVIPGSASGLQLVLAADFDCATAGLACGPPSDVEELGWALTIGNFDGQGARDLAAGVPGYGPQTTAGSHEGGVEILYSALFAADFETGNVAQWSSSVP